MHVHAVYQGPYVNVFKQFGVGQWKKCCKEGDVSSVMVCILYTAKPAYKQMYTYMYYTLYMNDIRGHKQGNTSEHLRQLFVEEKYNTIHKASLNNYTNVAIIMNSSTRSV